MESKTVVVAKDGKAEVLTGSAFHTLVDHTRAEFVTTSILDFAQYLIDCPGVESLAVYYDETQLIAVEKVPKISTCAVAVCNLKLSQEHDFLLKANGEWKGIDSIELLLKTLKRYHGADGRTLLSMLQNLSLKKVTSVERQKDNQGNFSHVIQVKNDKDVVDFPESITFDIPLFDLHDDFVEIPMEVEFKWEQGSDSVSMMWRLINLSFGKVVRDAVVEAIKAYSYKLPCPKYWGLMKINRQTDSWRYMHVDSLRVAAENVAQSPSMERASGYASGLSRR